MNKASFSYKFLNQNNINDWQKIFENSSESWHTFDSNNNINKNNINTLQIIIYKKDIPVAIFLSNKNKNKFFFQLLSINILVCRYEGLIIDDKYINDSRNIYKYFNLIIKKVFKNQHKIDVIKYNYSPNNISFLKNNKIIKTLYKKSYQNDLLVVENNIDYLKNRKYNLRREIKLGNKHLNSNPALKIIDDKSLVSINNILELQKIFINDKKLKNFNFNANFFEKRLKNNYYKFYIIKKNNKYIYVNIYTKFKNFITNHYMIQDEYCKKNFLAKAMYYKIIDSLKGDSVFVLGIENDIDGVDWFKKQMSNHKIKYQIFEYYLSFFSLIYLVLSKFYKFIVNK